MTAPPPFVDIHCHLIPGIDDGAQDLETALAMAQMAVADGTTAIVATPHQLGSFSSNSGDLIRQQTARLQQCLNEAGVPLTVLPGGDVRIEDGMLEKLASGHVLTLADRRRHVLLELPHELYFSIDGLLDQLRRSDIVGVLSHPERNSGLLQRRELVAQLVDADCQMQITAGSLLGSFGRQSEEMCLWMLREGLVHFVASDGHSSRSRRPLLRRAFQRVADVAGLQIAHQVCCHSPAKVLRGETTPGGRTQRTRSKWGGLLRRRRAA